MDYKTGKYEAITLKEAFNEMFETYNLKNKFNETHIIASWEKLMGKPIARRTTRIFIKNKKMFVEISSAPLKHELSMSKTRVLEILNKEIGEEVLVEIVFI